jgi:hypothetical protein
MKDRTDNIASGIRGRRVGGEPTNETEHFFNCAKCGQAVDMRDLGQVFHHETDAHKPLPVD